jgi:hypothetical protein
MLVGPSALYKLFLVDVDLRTGWTCTSLAYVAWYNIYVNDNYRCVSQTVLILFQCYELYDVLITICLGGENNHSFQH